MRNLDLLDLEQGVSINLQIFFEIRTTLHDPTSKYLTYNRVTFPKKYFFQNLFPSKSAIKQSINTESNIGIICWKPFQVMQS